MKMFMVVLSILIGSVQLGNTSSVPLDRDLGYLYEFKGYTNAELHQYLNFVNRNLHNLSTATFMDVDKQIYIFAKQRQKLITEINLRNRMVTHD